MKTLVTLILLFPAITFGQSDSIIYAYPAQVESFLYFSRDSYCTGVGMVKIESPDKFAVVDYDECLYTTGTNIFYKILFREIYYLLRAEDVKNNTEVTNKITKLTLEQKNELLDKTKIATRITDSIYNARYNQKDSIKRAINKKRLSSVLQRYLQLGLLILNWGIYDQSDYTEGAGIRFSIYNTSKKTVKYIWFTVTGYNPVGDIIRDIQRKSSQITLKGIGPIRPNGLAEYDFEYTWFTDLVETAKINLIKVQYMDGTYKTISNPMQIVINEEIAELLKEDQ